LGTREKATKSYSNPQFQTTTQTTPPTCHPHRPPAHSPHAELPPSTPGTLGKGKCLISIWDRALQRKTPMLFLAPVDGAEIS